MIPKEDNTFSLIQSPHGTKADIDPILFYWKWISDKSQDKLLLLMSSKWEFLQQSGLAPFGLLIIHYGVFSIGLRMQTG